jgi:hypothetical protein
VIFSEVFQSQLLTASVFSHSSSEPANPSMSGEDFQDSHDVAIDTLGDRNDHHDLMF